MLIVDSNQLWHGFTFSDLALRKHHNDCKGSSRITEDTADTAANIQVALADIRDHVRHNGSNHQDFYPPHVLSHLPHEGNPRCLLNIGWDDTLLACRYYSRERLPMQSDSASLGHTHSWQVYQPQRHVHRKRSTQHCHRYPYSFSTCEGSVGTARKPHAPTVRDWDISIG